MAMLLKTLPFLLKLDFPPTTVAASLEEFLSSAMTVSVNWKKLGCRLSADFLLIAQSEVIPLAAVVSRNSVVFEHVPGGWMEGAIDPGVFKVLQKS